MIFLPYKSLSFAAGGGGGGGPTLTEIGTVRSDGRNNTTALTETISVPGAGTLIVEVAWGDQGGGSTETLTATLDTVAMTKEVEVTNIRANVTILSETIPSSGSYDLEMAPSGGTAWRGFTYRVFLLTGETSITPLSDTAGAGAVTLDISSNVSAGDLITGAAMIDDEGTGADATFTGLTEDHELRPSSPRVEWHFSAEPSSAETPRTMQIDITSASASAATAAAILIS